MAVFGIRFFLCNLFICVIVCIFLIIKQALRNHLTGRMQFRLWFLLLGLLAVPFVPVRLTGFTYLFLWPGQLNDASVSNTKTATEIIINTGSSNAAEQLHDFALSVSSKTPSVIGLLLSGIWMLGVLFMLLSLLKAGHRLNSLKKSALPLQNQEVRLLYHRCLSEMNIKRCIPIYSTAFLKSPVITGLFRPAIYLPIHLISDFNTTDLRYMLLHELQHYKHKDAVAGCLMSLAGILYWFNPFVSYALNEMKNDREIACDTSVLQLLDESDYADYGNTLINFAEKISLTPFPFAVGMSGSMKQMQKRIMNISSYQKPSVRKKLKGTALFGIMIFLFVGLAPMLSIHAAESDHYRWDTAPQKISVVDLSSYFHGYDGSFVLYDLKEDIWNIYNMDHALLRTAPDSTYKIYCALFGLEEGIITPEDSLLAWDKTDYSFEAWNADQNLHSAMQSSVNWYFQEINERLGISAVKNDLHKIGYGNEQIQADFSTFWLQSSLKISPVEQVKLLTNLYHNDFGFASKNINAVKDSICLFSSESGEIHFYGKTGTGRIDGRDVSGWFVGFVETAENTYFFAAHIQSDANASGSKAAEITRSVLPDLVI